MRILINASNLKLGGGVQVADSVCNKLNCFPDHQFIVVLSSFMDGTAERIKSYGNVEIVRYDIKNSFQTLVFGRDSFLDRLVENKHIDCVLTIFGPSRWNPKVPHLSGFAMSHLVLTNSPYFRQMKAMEKIKTNLRLKVVNKAFVRSTRYFYTENEFISKLLREKWNNENIYTVTNYYNQIFDNPDSWTKMELPPFSGITLLTVATNYPHKNLSIAIDIAKILKERYKDLKFRFVFTVSPDDFSVPDELKENFLLLGKVDIAQCPSLYQQSDIAFQPTLLECFTATYPEAMRMNVPIVTTDLEFARGLCGDAALYYSPLDADEAAELINRIANDSALRNQLVEKGKQELKKFDNYDQRVTKLIQLCELIAKN